MTALAQERYTRKVGGAVPEKLQFGCDGGDIIYEGAMVSLLAATGMAAPAGVAGSGHCKGVAEATVDNSAGADDAVQINLLQGSFWFANSTAGDAIAATEKGKPVYIADDQTVAKTSAAGTRAIAGLCLNIDSALGVLVLIRADLNQALEAEADTDDFYGSGPAKARYVMTTNVADLGDFTVAQDGVTGVEGDKVLLVGQTTKSENGLYEIGTVATGTAPLTRSVEMPAGLALEGGSECLVSEGTVFADTVWFISTNGSVTIGTTVHDWYPRAVSQTAVLVAGTVTISNVPILSATKSAVLLNRHTADTSTATTGGYHATVAGANGITPGVVGTAEAVIQACVAAGTINSNDVSTLHVTILN